MFFACLTKKKKNTYTQQTIHPQLLDLVLSLARRVSGSTCVLLLLLLLMRCPVSVFRFHFVCIDVRVRVRVYVHVCACLLQMRAAGGLASSTQSPSTPSHPHGGSGSLGGSLKIGRPRSRSKSPFRSFRWKRGSSRAPNADSDDEHDGGGNQRILFCLFSQLSWAFLLFPVLQILCVYTRSTQSPPNQIYIYICR